MNIFADLRGKRALVTGASSDGLGRYFALTLAQAGCDVVAAARRPAKMKKLVEEIANCGVQGDAIALDVTVESEVEQVFEENNHFDIVVNNAGISVVKPIVEQTISDFDTVLKTNLHGVWLVSKAAAIAMQRANQRGSIINIASITALRQIAGITPYAVSKAAVVQLTKQMALEFATDNIRVNAIAPGYFETDMNREFFKTTAGKRLIQRVPMQRLGDYESLKGVLLLLASESSSFISGVTIPVDGGHLVSSL